MSYKLLSEKLLIENKKIVTRDEIRGYCKSLKLSYESAINYLLGRKYIVRILRGIFYVKGAEERKKKVVNISFYEAISEAIKIKGITNWYFGLESAIKLNNLTHEYFTVDYVISDKLKRPHPIEVLGHKVKFIAIKKGLTEFGIKKAEIPYSEVEKTVLDIVYLGIYNNLLPLEIKNKIADYLDKCDKIKLINYAKHYPKTVLKFIQKGEI